MKKRGLGQSWSLDIVLAFVIFVLIIAIFYTLLSNNKATKGEKLQIEAYNIANNLDESTGMNSNLAVISKGTVDANKLETLYKGDYNAIKNQFGIRGDFCIYLVNQDGILVPVDTGGVFINGFGNGNLSINGHPCGTQVSP